jgi:hypothetical protein
MNIMNFMKHSRGMAASPEKKHVFFSGRVLWGSFHVHFASYGSLNPLCELKVALFIVSFFFLMNIMKVYEEGVFMAFFLEAVLYWTAMAKVYELAKWASFINLQKGAS